MNGMQNAHFESHIIGFTFVRRALFNVFLLFFFFFSNFAWRKVTEEIFLFYISVFFLSFVSFQATRFERQALWILDLYMRLEIRLNARHLLSNANAIAIAIAYNTMHSMRIAHPMCTIST